MADPHADPDRPEPGWYLRHLEVYVRNALDVARRPPAEGDPGLPDGDRPLLERVVEHLAWCQTQLERAAGRAAAEPETPHIRGEKPAAGP